MSNLDFINEIFDASTQGSTGQPLQTQVLSALASRYEAVVAVIWEDDGATFVPEYQLQLEHDEIPELKFSASEHDEILRGSLGPKPKVLHDVTDDSKWILGLVSYESSTTIHVVELLLPIESRTESLLVDDLALVSKVLRDYHNPNPGRVSEVPTAVEDTSEFAELVHQSIDFRETSDVVANELRRVLDVDRVSVLKKKRDKWVVQSVSGQVSVNRRSGMIRRMERLACRCLLTGQGFFHPSNTGVPPQIGDSLEDYLEHTEIRTLSISPVFHHEKHHDRKLAENPNAVRSTVIAGIVVENYRAAVEQREFEREAKGPLAVAGLALRNAHEHQRLLLYPVWRYLGKTKVVMAARNIRTSLLVLFAVVVIALCLGLIPAKFNVVAKGVLVPAERRNVFAELQGIVVDVPVSHQSMVETDQTLVRLINEDLDFELEQVSGEILELRQRLASIQAERIANSGQRTDQESNVKGIQTQLESLVRLHGTLKAKSNRLNVVSPISGEVITWDLEDRLLNRPVQPGELLVEIANVDGEWELIVDIPSRKAGHVLRAKNSLGQLSVVYAIASEPGVWRTGEVIAIEGSARLQPDQTQTITMRVKIELDDVEYSANTGVVAKINCGTRSLGYVWCHDAWEYVQENIIFRIW